MELTSRSLNVNVLSLRDSLTVMHQLPFSAIWNVMNTYENLCEAEWSTELVITCVASANTCGGVAHTARDTDGAKLIECLRTVGAHHS